MPKRMTLAQKEAAEKLEDWLAGLPDIFVTCRDLGHPKRVEKKWGTETFYRRRLVCLCGYSYEQNIHHGRIVWTGNRSYPTGYLKPGDATPGRIDPAVFREMADSMVEFDSDMPPGLAELIELAANRP